MSSTAITYRFMEQYETSLHLKSFKGSRLSEGMVTKFACDLQSHSVHIESMIVVQICLI